MAAAKEEAERLTIELEALRTEFVAEKARADTLASQEVNLENLCGVLGINPGAALQGSRSSDTRPAILAAYDAIKDPVEATTFYRKNKAEIDLAYKQKQHATR